MTLFWALYLLAHAPAYQERIAAEAGRPLVEMPVTRAVVNETLRLYPPAFTLARQALAPDQVDGLDIPKGMVVLISPWVLHRHRKLWPEPDGFDPERFMPDAPPPPRFAFLPFGAGPRVCVGAQFALAEAAIVLARLVGAFRIALRETQPVIPTAIITTQPNPGRSSACRRAELLSAVKPVAGVAEAGTDVAVLIEFAIDRGGEDRDVRMFGAQDGEAFGGGEENRRSGAGRRRLGAAGSRRRRRNGRWRAWGPPG